MTDSTERTGWRANTKPHDGPHPILTLEEERARYEAMLAEPDTVMCRLELDPFELRELGLGAWLDDVQGEAM